MPHLPWASSAPPHSSPVTETLLAEHRQHRARERTVTGLIRRMQSHWRRWPEIGWANPDSPTDGPPAHPQWRADANRMLDTASAWFGEDSDIARHLDAKPGARAGLETAVRELDRTCARDNYRLFERLWHGLRTNECESMVYGRRYDEVTALGEALMDCDELTPAQHAVLGQWREAHEQAMARVAQVERYPDEAAALIEAWHNLHSPEDPDATDDPADPLHRKWRNDIVESRTKARAMLAPGSVYAPHLSALPDRGAAVRRAAADLDDVLRTQACRSLDWLARDVERSAEAAGTIPFYAPRCDELAAWAESLGDTDSLPGATRRLLGDWREDHDACLRRRAEIEAFPDRAAALLAARDGHGQRRRDATTLIEAGRVMLADAPGDRPHLDAMPGVRNRIAEALSPLVRARQAESKSTSADGAYIVPCRDRVLPGDRIRCTVHGRSGYGFSTDGEKLLIEGEVRHVTGYGHSSASLVSVRITARPDDRGPSPGSEPLTPMSELLEFRYVRMLWEAGVASSDVRGNITSHRARATIASQLFNSREPISLFELQAWLGHGSPASTQHYVAITPTKLAKAYSDAGYFERSLRAIGVLIDQDTLKQAVADGERWRYYDLGHGLCTYEFFDQCAHRMACARCDFYRPREFSLAQLLDAKVNILRFLQQIPLTDEERAAV